MHFKESKQMIYGMICREGKGKGGNGSILL